ncbi:M1 family aminopeptidase [Hymenobacter jeollabukensis]|uniref:M1 family aminopeptidase n=1 Tax=Hymenobacter jeollabukensis TaxID=2025313 RepID=UPI001FE61CB2|nr:M1 family aminopeptidase [Hymenobacter jeollabukensis]
MLLLFGMGLLTASSHGQAQPTVRIQLQAAPATHSFSCRYTLRLPAADTASTIVLHLNRQLRLDQVRAPESAAQRVERVFYPYFADTVQRVTVRFARPARKARQLTLSYSGALPPRTFTEQAELYSAHSGWLPYRPYREYDLVQYALEVDVPPGYEVRSSGPARKRRRNRWTFAGTTSALEPTALIARQFANLASPRREISVCKAGAAPVAADSALLRKAEAVIAFYNRTIGRQDSISHFRILLPGTNANAFGLLDNATVITYTSFDVQDRGDLLILAHEISHKWWGYGSVHDENDWLNEAFATYSSLLYLQASGDTTGYRERLTQLTESAVGTPAIIGFNRYAHAPAMYRRVIYNKGTVVLAALRARLGTEKFGALLATVAKQRISTTGALLAVTEQVAGAPTRAWLLARLSE